MSECNIKFWEIAEEDLFNFEQTLKPGKGFADLGFIANTDTLLNLYQRDMYALAYFGITIKQIVDILTAITEKYKRKLSLITEISIDHTNVMYSPKMVEYHNAELSMIDPLILSQYVNLGYPDKYCPAAHLNPIIIDKKYLVTHYNYSGHMPCPFGMIGSDTGDATDYWIYELATGKMLQFNALLIHLIEHHNFFEGNVYHRLPPENVIDFFQLKTGIDYSPEFTEVDCWMRVIEPPTKTGNLACQNIGKTNEVIITYLNKAEIMIECIQKINNVIPLMLYELDLTYCETLIGNAPIRHRLDLKKCSTYEKKKIKYVPLAEELVYMNDRYENLKALDQGIIQYTHAIRSK